MHMQPCLPVFAYFRYTSPFFLKAVTLNVAKHTKAAKTNISVKTSGWNLRKTRSMSYALHFDRVRERSFPIIN